MAYYNTWNPVYNFVMKIKKNYLDRFETIDYNQHQDKTCFEFWIDQLQDEDALEKIKLLEINQFNEFILLRYARYSNVYEETDILPNEVWDLYDGFYMECRSLVIDLRREEIVLAPFKKFRNLNECPENSLENITEKIRTAKTIEISNKLDGSMQSARWYCNRVIMSGSQAINPARSWRLQDGYRRLIEKENYVTMLKENPVYTFIFEYITLEDSHVVKYSKEQEGLYLIGMRNVATGEQLNYKQVIAMANKYDVLTTEIYDKTFEQILQETKTVKSDKQEGFVINIDGHMVKVKMDDYTQIHRMLSKVSSINLTIRCIADNTVDDLLSKIPVAYQSRVFAVMKIVKRYIEKVNCIVNSYVLMAPKGDRKEFMVWVEENVPKKYKSYVKNVYLGIPNNYIKSGSDKQPHYLRLKDMGVDDYGSIFEEE